MFKSKLTQSITNGQTYIEMIKYISYSMFDAFDAPGIQTVVNTVNCMGIMGKGLALEFKIRYPEMYVDYLERFRKGELVVGEPYLFKTTNKCILNFPTKNHWKYPSRIEFIESGLKFFISHYRNWNIKSIAFPRLGCTSGNLEWSQVGPVMKKYLNDLKDIDVHIFLDQQTSDKEREFLKIFNDAQTSTLKTNFRLTDKQVTSLREHLKRHGALKRIRDLLEIKSIGPVAYKRALDRQNMPISVQREFGFSD